MKYTHLKVIRDLIGMSGYRYKKGEVYEILQEISYDTVTIRNKAGEIVRILISPNSSFLPYSSYYENLKTILE